MRRRPRSRAFAPSRGAARSRDRPRAARLGAAYTWPSSASVKVPPTRRRSSRARRRAAGGALGPRRVARGVRRSVRVPSAHSRARARDRRHRASSEVAQQRRAASARGPRRGCARRGGSPGRASANATWAWRHLSAAGFREPPIPSSSDAPPSAPVSPAASSAGRAPARRSRARDRRRARRRSSTAALQRSTPPAASRRETAATRWRHVR